MTRRICLYNVSAPAWMYSVPDTCLTYVSTLRGQAPRHVRAGNEGSDLVPDAARRFNRVLAVAERALDLPKG